MIDILFAVIDDNSRSNELSIFFKENKNRLYNIALSRLHNSHDAEDAVMESFAQIVDKPDRFFAVPREQRTAYASVITRNIASRMFGGKCSECLKNIDDHEYEYETELNDPEKIFFDNESARELIDIICSLNDGKKDVMMLSIIHNKSSAEIAQILDIPESTVRKRLSDARKLIRKIRKEHNDV